MSATSPGAGPMPFRILIDEAMKQTRRNLRRIWPSVALPVAAATAALNFVQMRWMPEWIAAAESPFESAGCALFAIGAMATMAIQIVAYGALGAASLDAVAGREVRMSRSWAFAVRPSTIGTELLAVLAALAGLLLFIVGMILIALRLAFTIPVMAEEGLRGPKALGRSWRLIRWNPGKRFVENTITKIFLLLFISGLISYAVTMVVQLPLSMVQIAWMARQAAAGTVADPMELTRAMAWLQLPATFLSTLLSMAVSIYSCMGLALLYFDARGRMEGSDIAAALRDRLAASPPPQAPPGMPGS